MYFQTHRYVREDCFGLYSLLGPTLLRARDGNNSIPQLSIGCCWKVQLFWLGKTPTEFATNSSKAQWLFFFFFFLLLGKCTPTRIAIEVCFVRTCLWWQHGRVKYTRRNASRKAFDINHKRESHFFRNQTLVWWRATKLKYWNQLYFLRTIKV